MKSIRLMSLAVLALAVLACALAGTPRPARAEDPCYQAVASGELDLALTVCSEQLAAGQDPPRAQASTLNNRGICLLAKGRFEEAVKDFDQAIILASDFAPAYANRGFALARLERYEQAIKDFDQAIALMPGNALAYFNRGQARLLSGDAETALADFDQSLRLDARYTPALVQRGRAWAAKGRPDRAMQDFDRAIAQDPQSAEAFIQRGLAWEKLRETRKALADFNQALALKAAEIREDAGRMDTLAAAYAAAGRFAEAARTQAKAITMIWPGAPARVKGAYEERLRAYKLKRPWREEPVKP